MVLSISPLLTTLEPQARSGVSRAIHLPWTDILLLHSIPGPHRIPPDTLYNSAPRLPYFLAIPDRTRNRVNRFHSSATTTQIPYTRFRFH
jgi:hypothetical protein